MTKKHFQLFADKIKAGVDGAERRRAEGLSESAHANLLDLYRFAADVFAIVAAEDNPRFDRDRFLRACGLR